MIIKTFEKDKPDLINLGLSVADPEQLVQNAYAVTQAIQGEHPMVQTGMLAIAFLVIGYQTGTNIREVLAKVERMLNDLEDQNNPALKEFAAYVHGEIIHGGE